MDIWHFALSELIRSGELKDSLATTLATIKNSESEPETFRKAIEALAASSLQSQSFDMRCFVDAMQALPLGLEELFALYIGKNVYDTLGVEL